MAVGGDGQVTPKRQRPDRVLPGRSLFSTILLPGLIASTLALWLNPGVPGPAVPASGRAWAQRQTCLLRAEKSVPATVDIRMLPWVGFLS